MTPFADYFSDANIIRQLCKARIKLAKYRHEIQFYKNINGRYKDGVLPPNLRPASKDIFPPRRDWHRFRPWQSRRQNCPAKNVDLESLVRATLVLRKTSKDPWVKNLDRVVQQIRRRVLRLKRFEFAKPTIGPGVKNRTKHEYRPLVEFPLHDKVIDSLVAKYLRETFDPILLDSCLAFRCRINRNPAPTIHDAAEKLVRLNRRHRKFGLFVAECDIKGFYDCVSHALVRQSLRELTTQLKEMSPSAVVDDRAVQIAEAYLRSYSFSRDVHPRDSVANRVLRASDARGVYKWHEADLRRLHATRNLVDIGVPQGSALSCFAANLVLHRADTEVEAARKELKARITYMRYCDDMILLSSDRRACHIVFQRYCRTVRSLHLPIHEPAPVKGYSTARLKRRFWLSKSNRPYHRARPVGKAVPWIQFVGYQVRYDGLVRVRPRSLKKEFTKLSRAAEQMGRFLAGCKATTFRKSKYEITHRFRMKLISMAVGHRELGAPIGEPKPMCWANGFKGLVGRRLVGNGLKALDRHRERQIRQVMRQLDQMRLPTPIQRAKKASVHKYYGFPYSYFGQFQKTR